MGSYFEIIKTAILAFPLIAFAISLPFLMRQYHKFGAVSFLRAAILYSFVLYLTCAYFLVIMPLPTFDEVAAMTTPRTQLIPFQFITDFITHSSLNLSDPNTYAAAFTESYFFVPIYNILLTIPFGFYLRYYFKFDLKKTFISTFLLSLFFELTQLSGLYFIYPRGYRLFDVDDLLLNTLGGVAGYFLTQPLLNLLPDLTQDATQTQLRGQTVSGLKRTLAFILNLFAVIFTSIIINILLLHSVNYFGIFTFIAMPYYFILPVFLNGSTPVEKYLHLAITDNTGGVVLYRIWLRRIVFILIYTIIPYFIIFVASNLLDATTGREIILLFLILATLLFYFITLLKFLFTSRPMLYEKLSQTKLTSTITQTA